MRPVKEEPGGYCLSDTIMKVPSSPVLLVSITWNVIMKPRDPQHWPKSGVVRFIIYVVFLLFAGCVVFQFLMGNLAKVEARFRQRQRFVPRVQLDHLGQFKNVSHIKGDIWDFQELTGSIAAMPKCVPNSLVVILITSSPENRERRDAIRNTWCSHTNNGSFKHLVHTSQEYQWRCAFMIGSSPIDVLRRKVQEEVFMQRDILLGTYVDSYRNLSLKVLTGFHWVASECEPQFVLKTDDDCFININLLLPFLALQPKSMSRGIYSGKMFFSDEGKANVIRNTENKWHVTEDQYAPESYPTYASGTGYVLSGDSVKAILHASRFYKPFPNEDAYIGVLAHEAKLHPIDSFRFSFYNERWMLCNFLYFLVFHQVLPEQQAELQAKAVLGLRQCRESIRTQWD